jgi:hypothetical protein
LFRDVSSNRSLFRGRGRIRYWRSLRIDYRHISHRFVKLHIKLRFRAEKQFKRHTRPFGEGSGMAENGNSEPLRAVPAAFAKLERSTNCEKPHSEREVVGAVEETAERLIGNQSAA